MSLNSVNFDVLEQQVSTLISPEQLALWRQTTEESRWQAVMSNAISGAAREFRAEQGSERK